MADAKALRHSEGQLPVKWVLLADVNDIPRPLQAQEEVELYVREKVMFSLDFLPVDAT
jgi:hypothetical protein